MKKLFLVPLLLGGLLQNAGLTATQAKKTTRTPARKSLAKRPPTVDPTEGDNVDGDDLTIRRAAVAGLGPQSGSVVVVDPATGRVLTMVNQKLGLTTGFTPCSIKLVTSLAALSEHIVDRLRSQVLRGRQRDDAIGAHFRGAGRALQGDVPLAYYSIRVYTRRLTPPSPILHNGIG